MSNQLIGLKELNQKLLKMDAALAQKTLKSALMFATSPVVAGMKAAAPRGTKSHKTHKGRLVAPGFLSRSVIRVGRLGDKGYELQIGVKPEAFYGVSFLDKGLNINARRVSKKGKKSRTKKAIKPYSIPAAKWFDATFIKNERVMVGRFRKKLEQRVQAALK